MPHDIAGRADEQGVGMPGGVEQRSGSRVRQGAAIPLVLPAFGSAKVKLELYDGTDTGMALFGQSHSLAMEENLRFPAPMPGAWEFDAKLAEYQAILSDLENLRLLAKNLTEQKDRVRKELEVLMNQRGSYVQMISRGNADVIASAGVGTQKRWTRRGVLPPPMGLSLELTQLLGELLLRRDRVAGARTYFVDSAQVIDGEELR